MARIWGFRMCGYRRWAAFSRLPKGWKARERMSASERDMIKFLRHILCISVFVYACVCSISHIFLIIYFSNCKSRVCATHTRWKNHNLFRFTSCVSIYSDTYHSHVCVRVCGKSKRQKDKEKGNNHTSLYSLSFCVLRVAESRLKDNEKQQQQELRQ